MTTLPVVLETLSRVAPLGIRFWDAVTCSTIGAGLVVTAHRADRPGRRFNLILNRTDTFVLQNVQPEVEFGAGDQAYWNSLLAPRIWVIDVTDQTNRFLPFSFEALAPHRSLFQWTFNSPPDVGPLVPLFSAPTRPISGGYGVLRANLHAETQFDPLTEQYAPAAWAMIEAWYQGVCLGRGLANEQGTLLLPLPYPEPISPINASPLSPPQPPRSLTDQHWPIELQAFYSSVTSPLAVASARPTLTQLMQQSSATLLSSLSPLTPLTQADLQYGVETVLRTGNLSELLITP